MQALRTRAHEAPRGMVDRRLSRAQRIWQELFVEVTRAAKELGNNGDTEQALALFADAKFLAQRADRHIKQLRKRAAANDA